MIEETKIFYDKLLKYKKTLIKHYYHEYTNNDWIVLSTIDSILEKIASSNFEYLPEKYVIDCQKKEEKNFKKEYETNLKGKGWVGDRIIEIHRIRESVILFCMDRANGLEVKLK
jgi:hypothetical protein